MAKDLREPMDNVGKDSDYMMGHSASEGDRLDRQHVFFRHVSGDRLLSPYLERAIHSGRIRRVLDIGTGTGIWCYDVAAELQAMNVASPIEIVGVDVSENDCWQYRQEYPPRIQGSSDAYATISFQVTDLNDDVEMDKLIDKFGQFDLINSRMMISAVKHGQWAAYMERMFRLLRPGGYVQLFEADMVNSNAGRSKDPTVSEALVITHAVYSGLGLDPETAVKLTDWLCQAGFVHVRDTAHWCNSTVRQSDGSLKVDEISYEWHATAYGVLQPFFLKLRNSPDYPRLLAKLPPHAFHNMSDDNPENLLASEAEYEDFVKRHDSVLRSDPRYRTTFRTVLAQRPE